MTDLPVDPYTVAQAILQAVVDGYADAAVALPDRQLVIGGALPAWDAPQVTVALQRIYEGLIGQEQGQAALWQHGILVAAYQVQVVRKARATLANAPRRSTPATEDITADGEQYMLDARTLSGALAAAKRAGTIRPGQRKVKTGPVTSLEQQGEYLGLAATVEVQLV